MSVVAIYRNTQPIKESIQSRYQGSIPSMHISGEGRQGREAVVILDTPGILEAEGAKRLRPRTKQARERSEQHSSDVSGSQTGHLPEAPKRIRPGVYILGIIYTPGWEGCIR